VGVIPLIKIWRRDNAISGIFGMTRIMAQWKERLTWWLLL
jgi:hypothetical protein